MNNTYQLLENHIRRDEQLEEFNKYLAVGAAGIILLKILYFISVIYKYSNLAIKEAKVDEKLTKRFNQILPDNRFNWKVRIVKENGVVNAWTYGGENLYITTGLLKVLNTDEVMAIMLHEAGHSKEFHVWQRMAVREGGFAAILFTIAALFGADDVDPTEASHIVGVGIIAYMACMLLAPIIGLAENYWSRVNEYWADSWATKHGYGDHLISAFKKLMNTTGSQRKVCKSIFCKLSRKIDELLSTHPDMQKRIEAILKSSEGKKALKANKNNPTNAMMALAKVGGVTEDDVKQLKQEI